MPSPKPRGLLPGWLRTVLAALAIALLATCASEWDYIWETADEWLYGDDNDEGYGFGASSSDDLPHFSLDDESDDRDR